MPSTSKSASIFHSVFQISFIVLSAYWYWHVPAPGKCVMAIGVAAVLMTTWEMKAQHKAVWLLLVFFLAFLENKSIDKERGQANADQKADFALAQSTSNTASQILTTEFVLEARIDTLNRDLQAARRANNPQRVAALETKKNEAQKQLVLSMTPGIIAALENEWRKCNDDDIRFEDVLMSFPMDSKKRDDTRKQREDSRQECSQHAIPLLVSGDYVREGLLATLPNHIPTQEDRVAAAIFSQALAGKYIEYPDLHAAASYLHRLLETVAPPHS